MSRAETIRRYLAERYPVIRYVPLAVLLAAAGALSAGPWRETTAPAFSRSVVAAYVVVLAFRIDDDLEDRDVDAVLHPERTTVRGNTSALAALWLCVAILAGLTAVSGPQPVARAAGLTLLAVLLFLWYRVRSRIGGEAANAQVLMLKYPAIAAITASTAYEPRDAARAVPFLAGLYLLLSIHEWLDDPRLRSRLSSIARGSRP